MVGGLHNGDDLDAGQGPAGRSLHDACNHRAMLQLDFNRRLALRYRKEMRRMLRIDDGDVSGSIRHLRQLETTFSVGPSLAVGLFVVGRAPADQGALDRLTLGRAHNAVEIAQGQCSDHWFDDACCRS